jgi:hypothetical protein
MRGLVLVLLTGAFAAAAAASPNPALRLSSSSPLVVAGTHFRPLGTVKVTVSMPGKSSLSTRTSRRGTFSLSFAKLKLAACGSTVKVQAFGARGESATLWFPRPSCTVTSGSSGVGVSATAPDGSSVSAG